MLDAASVPTDVREILALVGADAAPSAELADAILEARRRSARLVERSCSWGACTISVDPVDNTVVGSWGPVLCPCEHLPGWAARHPEGRPKVGWSGKAKGRHGSRVARSKARRRELALYVASLQD